MKTHTVSSHHRDMRVHELAQLFNSMDPTPFHSKARDREAETFIEAWACGFSPKSPLHLTIHLQHMPSEGDPTTLVTSAIHHHFSDRADLVRRDLRDLFWQGRISLLIGLAFVALCLLVAEAIGQPLGIAGLWSSWKSPKAEWIHSYTMLTINADEHPLMRLFHKPTDEKRMVVILESDRYQDWLEAPVEHSMEFMRPFPADALQVSH